MSCYSIRCRNSSFWQNTEGLSKEELLTFILSYRRLKTTFNAAYQVSSEVEYIGDRAR